MNATDVAQVGEIGSAVTYPSGEPDPRVLLGVIVGWSEAEAIARSNVQEAVAAARECGCTWDEIGEALGVTRQAASRRFGGE